MIIQVRSRITSAVLCVLAALVPPSAHAWGPAGHMAVCQIALLELSDAKQQLLQSIMATEPDHRFKTFPDACTWADDQKHTTGTIQNQRRDDHFINVPRSLKKITTEDCGTATHCLFKAIHNDSDDLKPTSGKDRLQALKFLGHWLGDIHQPLHVSYKDDSGGNAIGTQQGFDCADLHTVWDSCIPDDLMRQMGAKDPVDLASQLRAKITDAQRTQWRNSSPVDWAAESYTIARTKNVKYCTINQAKTQCCYTTNECIHKKKHRIVSISKAYEDNHASIVAERLQRAGVRLAKLLDEALQ